MRKSLLGVCLMLPFLMGFTPQWGEKLDPANGVKKYYRHIQVPATLSGTPADQPTSVTVNSFGCLRFPNSGAKYAYFQFEVGSDWIPSTNWTVEVDWMPDSGATSGTDTVKWDVNYQVRAEGETLAGSTTTVSATDDGDYARYLLVHSPLVLDRVDATNPINHEDHMFFQVTRDTGVANNFSGTVCVTSFEVIYWSQGVPETQ